MNERAQGTGAHPGELSSRLQQASDVITERLGLAKIENFSASAFFSDVFKRHDNDATENLFVVGSVMTTPPLSPDMANLPSPWMFFRVLASSIVAYFLFLMSWSQFQNENVIPGLIMVGSFAVPFSILVLFFEINTPRNVSLVKLIQMVVMGGGLSILVSLFMYELAPLLGIFGAPAAGLVEESGKLATVIFVMRLLPMARYPYRLNALLFGAAVGCGFAAFESAGYALRIGFINTDAMLHNINVRGALAPFGHIVWTAIATSAYWIARKEHPDVWSTVRASKFLTLFAAPVLLHFIWDLDFEGPLLLKYWVLGLVAWIIVISLIQSGLREVAERCSDKRGIGMGADK